VRVVFETTAAERGAPLDYVTAPLDGCEIGLAGSHQPWNAALAVQALALAGLSVPDAAIARGLRDVQWPGRFQLIHERFVIDGAHNPSAAHRLALTWQETYGEKRATLILGILRDKDLRGICEALLPIAGRILTVPVPNPRTASPQEICKASARSHPGRRALRFATCRRPSASRNRWSGARYITGSLFLVGEALAHSRPCPRPSPARNSRRLGRYKSLGLSPVCLATRESIRGPISSPS